MYGIRSNYTVDDEGEIVSYNYSFSETQEMKKRMERNKAMLEENKNIAIDWFIHRIEELGAEIDAEAFKRDLMQYIDGSIESLGGIGMIITSPTFSCKKRGKISLDEMFKKHGIKEVMQRQVISIVIRPHEIVVVDTSEFSSRKKLKVNVDGTYYFVPIYTAFKESLI